MSGSALALAWASLVWLVALGACCWLLRRSRAWRQVSVAAAVAGAAGIWAVFYGVPVASAVRFLVSPRTYRPVTSAGAEWHELWSVYLPGIVAALALFAVVRRGVGVSGRAAGLGTGRGPRASRQLVAWTFIAAVALVAWAVMANWLPQGPVAPWAVAVQPGSAGQRWMALDAIAVGVFAAITEEIVVVAIPVMLLLRANVRLGPLVIAVLLAARVSYHVYYGWAGLAVVGWAGVFLWIYIDRGTLWPLFAAHLGFDAVQGLGSTRDFATTGAAVASVLVAGMVGYLFVEMFAHQHRQRRAFTAWATAARIDELSDQYRRLAPSATPVTVRRRAAVPIRSTRVRRAGRVELRIGPGLQAYPAAAQRAALAREASREIAGAAWQAGRWPVARVFLTAATGLFLAAGAAAALYSVAASTPLAGVVATVSVLGAFVAAGVDERHERRRRRPYEDEAHRRAARLIGPDDLAELHATEQLQADPLVETARRLAKTCASVIKVDVLGRYHFSTTDLAAGDLRPLRDPTAPHA